MFLAETAHTREAAWLHRPMDQDFRHCLTQEERAKSVCTTFNSSAELDGAGYCSGKKKLVRWRTDVVSVQTDLRRITGGTTKLLRVVLQLKGRKTRELQSSWP